MSGFEVIGLLWAALLWDLFFGEVPSKIHPVVWIGRLIGKGEKWWFSEEKSSKEQFFAGILVVFHCLFFSVIAYQVVVSLLAPFYFLEFLFMAYILKSSFALKELGRAGFRVEEALSEGRLMDARFHLRSLCSRRADKLSQKDLISATCSSLGENLADSFVAPLFYYALFGLPGALCYRVVNTLDARIGYHGKYEYFGKFSARLDDVLGYIPSRLTAGFFILAGGLLHRSMVVSLSLTLRDGAKTKSPNGGWPMAALAAVLGVRLEKKGAYALGDGVRKLSPSTIAFAWHVVMLSALLFAAAKMMFLLFPALF